MSNLLLRFRIELESPPIRTGILYTPGLFGPQFHRWAPEGEKDAISLVTGDSDVTISVWFERFGFVDGNLIKFDYNRQEIDPQIMAQHGRVDGGPLFALMKFENLSYEDTLALGEGNCENDRYKALEKRVLKLFYPPVINFLRLLRTRYGQYWIPEIEKWNSRNESVSSYLRRYGYPEYSIDGGLNWKPFASTSIRLSVNALRKQQDFSEYITKTDWQEIADLVQKNTIAQPSASMMIEAIELFDRGFIRHAIIDAVTALEIGIGEAFRELLSGELGTTDSLDNFPLWVQIMLTMSGGEKLLTQTTAEIKKTIRSTFFNFNLEKQFEIIGELRCVSQTDKHASLRLINIRNAIVHEGKEPPYDIEPVFSGAINAFTIMFPTQNLRFPLAHAGNQIVSPDN